MLTQLPSLYVYENINYALKLKSPCKAVTTTNVALLSGTTTIDDVALIANDRVLLVGQIDTKQNGIWVIHAGAWTRPDDFAVGASASSAYCFIDQGTVYKDTGWLCVSDSGADVVGTNELVYIQFSSAGQLTFTNGVTKTNFTVSNDLITGKAGGQTIIGGTAAAESITIKGSSHASNGPVILSGSYTDIMSNGNLRLRVADGTITSYSNNITISSSGLSTGVYGTITLTNGTASTQLAPVQYSPGLLWRGSAWDTDDNVSRQTDWIAYVTPTNGNSVYSSLTFASRIDGGAWSPSFTFVGSLFSTSPQLRVNNGTSAGPTLRPISTDGTGIFFPNGTGVSVATGSTERLAISATGACTFTPANNAAGAQEGLTIAGASTSTDNSVGALAITSTLTPGAGANARVVRTGGTVSAGTGITVTGAYGIHVGTMAKAGTGTITNAYGLMIDGQTAGTNNYSLYVSGGTSAFQGTLLANWRLQVGGGTFTTGVGNTLLVTGGASTGGTASTEYTDVLYDLSAVKTWAQGNITTQRDVVFKPRTYAFTGGASSISTAATVAIEGSPIAGTNATINNRYALWVQNGATRFDGQIEANVNSIGAAQDLTWRAINNTPSSAGTTTQNSPGIFLRGSAYESTGGTSQFVDWLMQAQPVTGTVATGNLVFSRRTNGAGWVQRLTIGDDGSLWAGGGYVASIDGSAAAPILKRAGGGTGVYFPSSTDVALATGSTERFRISATGAASFTAANNASGTQTGITFGGTVTSTDGAATGVSIASTIVPAASAHARGVYVQPAFSVGTGIVAGNGYGVHIEVPTKSGTGTITNVYTLYVGSPSIGSSSNYAIYSPGYSFFHSIGTTAQITVGSNLLVGTGTSAGTNAAKAVVLSNTATAPADSVDKAHLYCADASGAGTAALAIYQEDAPIAGAGVASTHKIPMVINGTTYYVLATTVR